MIEREAEKGRNGPGAELNVDRMPAYLLFARLGKRVLRPGGRLMTQRLIQSLSVREDDEVVEFAPGLGSTAAIILKANPRNYTGIERDRSCASFAAKRLSPFPNASITIGQAHSTGLASGSATVVVGEAILTLNSDDRKREIVEEASRILQIGGRYGVHELCLVPDNMPGEAKREIAAALSSVLHVAARPYTMSEWQQLLSSCGFRVGDCGTGQMNLLSPARIIRDEGLVGAFKFGRNVIKDENAFRRLKAIRGTLDRYKRDLGSSYIVAERYR